LSLWSPHFVLGEHGVEDGEQLAQARDHADAIRFAARREPRGKGGNDGFGPHRAALLVIRGDAGQGGNGAAVSRLPISGNSASSPAAVVTPMPDTDVGGLGMTKLPRCAGVAISTTITCEHGRSRLGGLPVPKLRVHHPHAFQNTYLSTVPSCARASTARARQRRRDEWSNAHPRNRHYPRNRR